MDQWVAYNAHDFIRGCGGGLYLKMTPMEGDEQLGDVIVRQFDGVYYWGECVSINVETGIVTVDRWERVKEDGEQR